MNHIFKNMNLYKCLSSSWRRNFFFNRSYEKSSQCKVDEESINLGIRINIRLTTHSPFPTTNVSYFKKLPVGNVSFGLPQDRDIERSSYGRRSSYLFWRAYIHEYRDISPRGRLRKDHNYRCGVPGEFWAALIKRICRTSRRESWTAGTRNEPKGLNEVRQDPATPAAKIDLENWRILAERDKLEQIWIFSYPLYFFYFFSFFPLRIQFLSFSCSFSKFFSLLSVFIFRSFSSLCILNTNFS